MKEFLITKDGFKELKSELKQLKNFERPNIISAVARARELGDLKENAEYHASREKQGMIEAQISNLEDKLSRVKVIDIQEIKEKDKIKFGATVKLENIENEKIVSYKIVSDYESDIDKGMIDVHSPVAKSLIGKMIGDEVEVKVPVGIISYAILDIKFI